MPRLNAVIVRAAFAAALLACGAAAAETPLSLHAANLNGAAVEIPGLATSRTLVLVGFRHEDQSALEDWRRGLELKDADTGWLEVPVIGVDNPFIRSMILRGMRGRYATPAARAHVAPMFAEAQGVAAKLGVDPGQPAAVVLDRSGRILARASGGYEPAKAQGLAKALHSVE